MAEDFVAGFLASVTLDAVDVTLQVETLSFSRSKSVLSKGSMDGTGFAKSIPGPETGTIDMAGHIAQIAYNDLEAAFAKDVPVLFVITVLEGLTSDAKWSGEVTLSDLNVDTNPDGNWAFQLSGETSGPVVYAPAGVV